MTMNTEQTLNTTNTTTNTTIIDMEPRMQTDQMLPTFEPKTATAILSHSQSQSQLITRDQLRHIPTPTPTQTWRPIPFAALVDELHNNLSTRDIIITREQITVSEDQLKLFATFDLYYKTDGERTAALGLRTSNNKTMAIQIAVGARVFVCDNMCFSGDLIALKRKHTNQLQLAPEINRGLDSFFGQYTALESNINRLKGRMLVNRDAEHIIYTAIDKDVVPVRLFRPISQSYRDTRANGHISAWQLHNCMTLHAHKLPTPKRFATTTAIGKLFSI